MGRGLDSHLKSTAGPIPACMKCHFVVEDADSRVKRLQALIPTFAPGPIRQTAGMVMVNETHRPQMQRLHEKSYCRTPLFSIGATYIIPLCVIHGAIHLLPLTPQ